MTSYIGPIWLLLTGNFGHAKQWSSLNKCIRWCRSHLNFINLAYACSDLQHCTDRENSGQKYGMRPTSVNRGCLRVYTLLTVHTQPLRKSVIYDLVLTPAACGPELPFWLHAARLLRVSSCRIWPLRACSAGCQRHIAPRSRTRRVRIRWRRLCSCSCRLPRLTCCRGQGLSSSWRC